MATPSPRPPTAGPKIVADARNLAFSPDGEFLATAANTETGGTFQWWDARNGRQAGRIDLSAEVSSIPSAPDSTLVTGSRVAIRSWELTTRQEVDRLELRRRDHGRRVQPGRPDVGGWRQLRVRDAMGRRERRRHHPTRTVAVGEYNDRVYLYRLPSQQSSEHGK